MLFLRHHHCRHCTGSTQGIAHTNSTKCESCRACMPQWHRSALFKSSFNVSVGGFLSWSTHYAAPCHRWTKQTFNTHQTSIHVIFKILLVNIFQSQILKQDLKQRCYLRYSELSYNVRKKISW